MGTVSLPYHFIFDILSRAPVKPVCRFRCVSKRWRDLISSPVFAAAHRSHHGPLLVDSGSFQEEEPLGGRDMRLLDMDGNVVRVLRGLGGYGMLSNGSLDDLICVNGASCGGVNVVDPATGEVLVSCPQMDVLEHDAFPYAQQRYYSAFGFGRAVPSGEYKLVRLGADRTCEVFTVGDGRGWRRVQQQSPEEICCRRGSPVVSNGLMYVFQRANYDPLYCFDLQSEQWRPGVIEGPVKLADDKMRSRAEKRRNMTVAIRLTELNGALCMVQAVFDDIYNHANKHPADPFTSIWILDSSDGRSWIKTYTIAMAPSTCRYVPLRVLDDGAKLLLQCSIERGCGEGWSVVLQIYDRRTDTCTNIPGTPNDIARRIGLCSFRFDNSVSSKCSLARFLDHALLFFSN
jgi:F-box interacting protein